MFELWCEICFSINVPSAARLLACCRQHFFTNCEAFFSFCHVVLGISNIFFDNSMQCMNKMWVWCGYSVKKISYGWIELSLRKNCFSFLFMIYNFTIVITRIHVRNDNSNTGAFEKLAEKSFLTWHSLFTLQEVTSSSVQVLGCDTKQVI